MHSIRSTVSLTCLLANRQNRPSRKSQIAIRIPVSSTAFKGWSLECLSTITFTRPWQRLPGFSRHISRVLPNILSYFANVSLRRRTYFVNLQNTCDTIGLPFINKVPPAERKNYTILYDFHLAIGLHQNSDKKPKLAQSSEFLPLFCQIAQHMRHRTLTL